MCSTPTYSVTYVNYTNDDLIDVIGAYRETFPKRKRTKKKNKKKKKVFSSVLSSVLVFSFSLTLFLPISTQLAEVQVV